MPTAYGYVRTSTLDQENGLKVQAEQVEAFYRNTLSPRYPDLALAETIIEHGVSGGKPFAKREHGAALDVRLQKGDHIIITKLDRGFRDTLDYLTTERAWRDRGITLHVLDLPFLGDGLPDYIAEFIRTAMAMVAQFERGRIRVRTKEIKAWLKRQGRPTNGHAGYGFKFTGRPGQRVRTPDESEQAVIRWIVRQHDERKVPFLRIWAYMLEKKIKTKGGKEWSMNRIYRAYRRAKSGAMGSSESLPETPVGPS